MAPGIKYRVGHKYMKINSHFHHHPLDGFHSSLSLQHCLHYIVSDRTRAYSLDCKWMLGFDHPMPVPYPLLFFSLHEEIKTRMLSTSNGNPIYTLSPPLPLFGISVCLLAAFRISVTVTFLAIYFPLPIIRTRRVKRNFIVKPEWKLARGTG